MAIKCLMAEKQETQYYFKYTLDDTKQDDSLIREWVYSSQTPEGMTDNEYVSMLQRELPLLAQSELDALDSPDPVSKPLAGF